MLQLRTTFLSLLLALFSTVLFAQKAEVDRLQKLLNTTFAENGDASDSSRIQLLVQASELLLRINPNESLSKSKEALRLSVLIGYNDEISHIYNNIGSANRIQGDYQKSLSFHNKALENDRKKGDKKAEALSLNNIGNVHLMQGYYQDAIRHYKRSLRIRQDINDQDGIASSLNNLGLVYKNQGDYDRALSYYQNAFKIFEQIGDKVGLGNAYNNIGIVYRNNGNIEWALDNFLKALEVFQKLGNKVGEANTLNNIGNIYYQQKKFDQALEFYNNSLVISQTVGDKNSMAGKLSNIGGVYLLMGNKQKALASTEKALSLQQEIGDDKGQISTLNNLGAYFREEADFEKSLSYFRQAQKLEQQIGDHSYSTITLSSLGEIYTELGDPKQGLHFLKQALIEAKTNGSTDDRLKVYQSLSKAHADAGEFEQSYHYQELSVKLKDSLERAVSSRDLAEMQIKFETAQKQREIELLNKEKEVQDLKLNKEITVRNMVVAITFLALVLLVLIYTRYRSKHRANEELGKKNKQIEQQKEIVEEKNWEITSSIEYAKRIQDAIMPTITEIRKALPDSFVFYQPKGIVSGDFYWFAQNNHRIYIAAVDCTGHGVPGAFLSMIGNDHLNHIVGVEKVEKPDEVLNRLHQEIQVTLKQKHGFTENHDGMDVALCAIDQTENKLYFSSANRYLYHIRNGELVELKGDHFNIGGVMHEDVRSYTLHEISLEKDDVFYIFSDGISDQFGGEKSKKFGYRRLKDTLLQMHQKPMAEQQIIYQKIITEWVGDGDQIDDFLLIGIRI
ncbi:tetratricopeptide repeat protein [Bacteroidota bacterium]